MKLNLSGWSADFGAYDFDIPFDDQKNDHEIRFKNGEVYHQDGPLQAVTNDWNNDGDVYTQVGAWFRTQDGQSEFFTPDMMLQLVERGEATVPGMADPFAALKDRLREKETARQETQKRRNNIER